MPILPLFTYYFLTDRGINLHPRSDIHQICLPTKSNDNPEKWKNRIVETVGYATDDFSGTRGDRMKVARMTVFEQSTCNANLEKKLEDNKACMFFFIEFYPG